VEFKVKFIQIFKQDYNKVEVFLLHKNELRTFDFKVISFAFNFLIYIINF
jgi:hypothetical protein